MGLVGSGLGGSGLGGSEFGGKFLTGNSGLEISGRITLFFGYLGTRR